MSAVIASLLRALGQLGDPAIAKVLVKSVLLTLAIFAALGLAGWWLLAEWLAAREIAWSAELGALVAVLATVIGGWLLFRIVALAVIQFFAEEIVLAVERRHYPGAAEGARRLTLREDAAASLRAVLRAVAANLLALPVALVLLVSGIGTLLLFWAVNAWLIGRELQDMVWLRHRNASTDSPPLGGASRFALGGVVAALLAVPFANLIAPVIGAAAATHLVHRKTQETA